MKSLFLSFFFALVINAYAGGDSFLVEIVSLTLKANDEYRLEFIQHTAPYVRDVSGLPARIIVHLRYKDEIFEPNSPSSISREQYNKAIAMLREQAAKGGKSLFGIMSLGFTPIKGKKGEFQSNALSILEQFNGEKVVYSFAKP
ncbi:MAG: hypothetical protein HC904_07845 [Blastochloris sp.]|nr:hypothetical protein [Blastochloris sp.]